MVLYLRTAIFKNRYPIVIIFATIVFLLTAYFSNGYYHADEHCQIIEFARCKLGYLNTDQLAWEYRAGLRPTLQPYIAVMVLKFMEFIQIKDPFHQAFALRLISAIIALWVLVFFYKSSKHLFKEKNQFIYLLILLFLWFIPFANVRFSSESWSGIFMLLGLAFILNVKIKDSWRYFAAGLSMGVSYYCRFQIVFMILGLGIWLIFIQKLSLKNILKLCSGFLIFFVIGFLLDIRFYNKFVFTSWEYFNLNILKGVSNNFGTSPFFEYFKLIFRHSFFPFAILFYFAILFLLVRDYKNPVLWMIIPFLLLHSIVSHKEGRFLFPLANFIPFLLISMIDKWPDFKINRYFVIPIKILKFAIITFFVLLNGIFIIVTSLKSAEDGFGNMNKYVYRHFNDQKVNLISTPWSSSFNPFGLPMYFYYLNDMHEIQINDICLLNDSNLAKDRINLLMLRRIHRSGSECQAKINEMGFVKIYQSLPEWMLKLRSTYLHGSEQEVKELYIKK